MSCWKKHVDYDWVQSLAGKNSNACSYRGLKGRLVMRYIYSVPRYKILWYNTILFYRYLKRLLKGEVR